MKYKIIMLATAAFALTQVQANAQMKGDEKCETETIVVTKGDNTKSNVLAAYEVWDKNTNRKEAPCTTAYVRYDVPTGNPRLKASYDMPGDVYEGKEVLSNDGVAKNMRRNMHYLNFSVRRVPNDGGLYMKE
ncbi:MAG: hypothetical protein KDC07_03500 [Chitinophagaceae bacterium]|nr:hypothetical protein [Chitinophagaceae bacterium]